MIVETAAEEKGQVEHSESPDSRPKQALTQQIPHAVKTKKNPPPQLEHGEKLTRDEFERRYEAMPHLKKAELIGGIVYMGFTCKGRYSRQTSRVYYGLDRRLLCRNARCGFLG